VKARPRAVLLAVSVIHFLHDGFSETLYVFLPLWASEFGLSLTQVGLIRTAYTGGMSAFQIPAGFLAERLGERKILALGTAVTALGFVAAGWAGGFISLLALLLCAGLGSGVQHPLSSSIVSKAYEDGNRRTALGTYNFSGDIGKAGVAAAIGVLAGLIGWRAAGATYGVLGVAAALAIVPMLSRLGAGGAEARDAADWTPPSGWGIRDGRGNVGDSRTRNDAYDSHLARDTRVAISHKACALLMACQYMPQPRRIPHGIIYRQCMHSWNPENRIDAECA